MHSRRCAALAVSLCLIQWPARSAAAQSESGPTCGTYEYAYPSNTEQLNENHFMVLDCSSEPIRGWYYGTSDDFDRGREGYLPGFFVAEMKELTVSGGRIRFAIQVAEDEYFTEPVPLAYRGAGEVPEDQFGRWAYAIRTDPRRYQGFVHADSVVLDVEGGERVFLLRPLRQGWIPEGIDRPVGLSLVVGDESMSLTLDTIRGYTNDSRRRPLWVTTDSISFDIPPEGFGLAPACGYDEHQISGEIFAVARQDWEAAVLRGVIQAWRINLDDLTLEPIPLDRLEGMVCYGFGTP